MARQPEQGPPESVIFGQFSGLKNTVARERLKPSELATAKNVDIDDAGQVRRRRGYEQMIAGSAHSLWTGKFNVYGVLNGMLSVIRQDYTTQPLLFVGDAPLCYTQLADTVYFSSTTHSGKIGPTLQIAPWGALASAGTWLSPVVRPTETLGEISGKLLGAPPHATSMVESSGRIWLANENVLWATELYLPDFVDKTRNFFQFESPITAMGSVGGGFYVGTEDACYFLSGELSKLKRDTVATTGVVPGSMVSVPASTIRPEGSSSREAVVFMTNDGIYAGLDGGACYNVTDTGLHFAHAVNSAALFRRQDGVNQYIIAADHGGTPTSTARIGDYIDAEIRRFTGD